MKPFTTAALAVILVVVAIAPASAAAPCERISFESARFTVCTFDAQTQDLRLVWRDRNGRALRNFATLRRELGREAARVRFAMNAGMFGEDWAPIGLFVENGVLRRPINTNDGPGNFHLKPNGVFWIGRDGTVHVDTTDAYIAHRPDPLWATQSGPMLVIGGALHPTFSEDGPSRHVRNGVGVRDAHTALFAISDETVSFGRFARLFRDALHCPDALYFDGTISSLWAPSLKRLDDRHDVGPMVVVLERAAR